MGYSDIIAHEVELLPPEKQVEILNLLPSSKPDICPPRLRQYPKLPGEIETFFRSFNVDTSGYKFDRDDANAR